MRTFSYSAGQALGNAAVEQQQTQAVQLEVQAVQSEVEERASEMEVEDDGDCLWHPSKFLEI